MMTHNSQIGVNQNNVEVLFALLLIYVKEKIIDKLRLDTWKENKEEKKN